VLAKQQSQISCLFPFASGWLPLKPGLTGTSPFVSPECRYKVNKIATLRRGGYTGKGGTLLMSQKKTIFVTVLGGVAEVDTATVPDDLEVEIVDLD